jgi:phage-related protein
METLKLEVIFFKTKTGNEPVREWLKSLPVQARKAIGEDIKTVQYGWPIGMPVVKSIGHGLWEVRSNFESGIARVLFTLHESKMILLHGFIKKTQKIPKQEIDLTLKRLKELKDGL